MVAERTCCDVNAQARANKAGALVQAAERRMGDLQECYGARQHCVGVREDESD